MLRLNEMKENIKHYNRVSTCFNGNISDTTHDGSHYFHALDVDRRLVYLCILNYPKSLLIGLEKLSVVKTK